MSLKESTVSICDSIGNLLLLSNSCYIETGSGVEVENSQGLNPGWVYDNFCEGPYDFNYNSNNNMVLLRAPGSSSVYYLFHERTYVQPQPLVAFRDRLYYTKMDMSLNNGNGSVTEKNSLLIQDSLYSDGLCAVRHANGRDWWIVLAKLHSNKYYILLLTPAGISIKEQSIGEPTWSEAGGEIVFSPDGSRLARFNTRDDLRLFDFDRCAGELSNPLHISFTDDTEDEVSAGLAFSADGRYLYAAEVTRILQFDLLDPDIAASMTLIAERETNPECPLGGSIGGMELTPDGRIFSRPVSGSYCVHVVNHPERPDTLCDFRQHQYIFDFAYKGLPHFPNFRLGPIDGSPCDTLGLDNHPLAGWRYDHTGGLGVDFTSVSWYEPEQWWWDFGDPASGAANSSTEKYPTHVFSAPGAYEVCLTVSNQYGSDTKCKTVWLATSSTDDGSIGEEEVVRLYPNPTTGQLYWSGTGEQSVTLRVFNSVGQLVAETTSNNGYANLERLPEGLYQIQLSTPDNKVLATQKLQIIRQ